MKYYLIAGEASGDLHGANLMREIKYQDANAEFRFFGGDLMQAQGGYLVKHYRDMAYMGFVEVALHLRSIMRNMKQCKQDILDFAPDIVILIDFAGFNLRIANFAKQHQIKTCFYIAPKVWAWNQGRVKKIQQSVDRLLCILPFEVDFFIKNGIDAHYVGNPILDAIASHSSNPNFRVQNKLDARPIVALLPGSRAMEIERLLPDMLHMATLFPQYQFVIAGAPAFDVAHYQSYMQGKSYPLVTGQTYDLLQNAAFALVTSGTATLETALFRVPQLVLYKMNTFTYAIAKRLVKVPYISLVNLIAEKAVVKEFIQDDCHSLNLQISLQELMQQKDTYQEMQRDYEMLANKMGQVGASRHAALKIMEMFKN